MTRNRYTNEYLISEIKRFNKEYGRPPIAKELDKKNTGFPSRKTYVNYFGSFGNALLEAGFEYRGIEIINRKKPLPKGVIRFSKEQIKKCIDEFVELNNRIPSLREVEMIPDYPIRQDFRRVFGGYNNALKEFGYSVNHVGQYTDDELKDAFLSFINKNERVPTIFEFNNSNYPSFWCYQNRFGSWTNAVKHYGFNPTGRKQIEELQEDIVKLCNEIYENENRKTITYEDINNSEYCSSVGMYTRHFKNELNMTLRTFVNSIGFDLPYSSFGMVYEFEDGEVAVSKMEFTVSNYLRKKSIRYGRNYQYRNLIESYHGKKDCDYVINYKGEMWYVEIAGMLENEVDTNSDIQSNYKNNLQFKIKMLESKSLNYKIIYKGDFNKKSLDEIFSFLFT